MSGVMAMTVRAPGAMDRKRPEFGCRSGYNSGIQKGKGERMHG
jgi:hypothetical protein